jgi:type IV pilus assembly protein PilW
MRKQSGLSLIELMIAITLGLVLMAGVMQVFLSSRVTFSTHQAMSRVQETGRLAMEFLSRDIRMAGFMGCASRSPGAIFVDTAGDLGGLHKDFAKGIEGFESSATGIVAKTGTDILVVRTADALPLLTFGENNANSLTLRVGDSEIEDNCSNGICTGRAVAASDCIDTRIYKAGTLSVVNETTLEVAGGGFPAGNFGGGAELIPVKTYVYFVAPSTADATRSSLWQKVNTDSAMELLEGVEDLSLKYGREGATDFVKAASVADWSKVNSVNVELLVASLDNNVLEEKQKFNFDGAVITAADRRLHQVFTSTVAARSNAF